MKNIKYLLLLAITTVFMTSCEDDNDSVTNPGRFNGSPAQVEISLEKVTMADYIVEDGGTAEMKVMLTKALPYDLQVTLEATSSDGSIVSEHVDMNNVTTQINEVTFTDSFVIAAGSTEHTITATFVDDMKVDGEVYTFNIANAAAVANASNEVFVTPGSVSVEFNVPVVFVGTAGDVDFSLKWTDGSRDMDFYLVTGTNDLGGSVVDSSLGFTTTETVTMPANAADGEYSLYVNQYAFTAAVDSTFEFSIPGKKAEILSKTVTQDSFVFNITKITDGNDVIYLVKEVN